MTQNGNKARILMINRSITPLKSLYKHSGISLGIFFVFMFASVISFVVIKPSYRSAALIHVSPTYVTNLDEAAIDVGRNYKAYAYNQIYIMKSYEVLQDALLRLGDKAKMWYKPEGLRSILLHWGKANPKLAPENLNDALDIELLSGSNMISVALEKTSPDGLAETVNAVVNAYLFRIKGDMVLGSDERRENLRRRKRELQANLNELTLKRNKLSSELGVVVADEKNSDPFRQNVESLYSAVYDAGMQAVRAKVQFEAENKRIKSFNKDDLLSQASIRADNNQSVREAYQNLSEQKALLKSMVENMKPSHPKRKKIEMEIEIRSRDYNLLRQKVVKNELQKLNWELAAQLEELRIKKDQTAMLEEHLKNKLEDYQKRMKRYNSLYQQASNLQREILRVRQQLENIDDTLDKFITEENAPGSIKLSSIARYPEVPNYKKKIKVFVALFFMGCLLTFAVPCLIDMLNPWILTPQDINHYTGKPAIACIVEGGTPLLHHFSNDQIRRMVIELETRRVQNGCVKIALTSVKPKGGTTELCFRICRAFTKMGVRPLLIEANTFKPDKKYGDFQHPGIIDIIRGKASIEECLLKDEEGKLPDRLRIGNRAGERIIPSGNHLNECINSMSDDYDVFLFDTPPVFLSSDTEMVARNSDAVILLVEANNVVFKEMGRALTTLEQVNDNVAILLNRAQVYKKAGYYADILEQFKVNGSSASNGFFAKLFNFLKSRKG